MTAANLPQWKCHKVVRAAKIIDWHRLPNRPGEEFHLFLEGGHKKTLPSSRIPADGPIVGGYYVVYEDGYTSFSPAEAFEAGYTRLPDGLDGLQPHQQRVVIEASELRDRLEKLTTFIADGAGPIFANLSLEERQDMQIQRISMKDCLMALDSRIARFKA